MRKRLLIRHLIIIINNLVSYRHSLFWLLSCPYHQPQNLPRVLHLYWHYLLMLQTHEVCLLRNDEVHGCFPLASGWLLSVLFGEYWIGTRRTYCFWSYSWRWDKKLEIKILLIFKYLKTGVWMIKLQMKVM